MNFEIQQIERKNKDGEPYTEIHLVFSNSLDKELMQSLLDITNDEMFYNDKAKVTPDYLFAYHDEIAIRAQSGNLSLISLAFYLAEFFKEKIAQYDKMAKDNKVTFDHLNKILVIGSKFVARMNNELVGSIVHATRYETNMFERYFIVTGLCTVVDGKQFIQIEKQFIIPFFAGLRNVKDLDVRPMTDDDNVILTKRGKIFLKYGIGTHYLHYTGEIFKQTMYGAVHVNALGRVVVDAVGFKTINANYCRLDNPNRNICNPNIADELLFMTWPFLYAFSLTTKQWGECYVDKLEPIKYDDDAFDYLVLNQDYKEMTKALVTNVNTCFTDIISNKSGGAIFLLHGPPGVGKTLTCEAIAELLHKPLYSITVGELGVSPDTLEMKLSRILEIANSWSAIILIDEADIFLEKRTDNDIHRNAMVGIFLRLLERHQGVLFLTTNRGDRLDEAFRSRISVIIKYDDLDKDARGQVWKNLLKASKVDIDKETIDKLVEVKTNDDKYINGRQIKNAIRMAQCIAFNKKESVTFDHLSKVIKLM